MNAMDYSQILALHKEIAPLIKGECFLLLKEVGVRKFILKFFNHSLLLSLQEPLLYFHLTRKKGNPAKTSFSKKVNAQLEESFLDGFEVLNEDRILKFSFNKKGVRFFLIAFFFPKKAGLFLTDEKMEILSSLNPFDEKKLKFPETNQKKLEASDSTNQSISNYYQKKEILLAFEKKRADIKLNLQRAIKKLLKNQKNFEESLKKALLFEEKEHEGNLLKAHFQKLKKGMDVITVLDWENENRIKEITIDPLLDPKEQLAFFFKRVKKMKASIPHHQEQIEKIALKLTTLLKELDDLENFTTLKELEHAYPVKIKAREEKALPFKEYISETGFRILVGKNSKCNDTLTFQYAKGNDLWLHVKDYPGSHVVIIRPKGKVVDQATIEKAVSLACYYSKAKNAAHAEVCLTEKKYVSRLGKKRDGKVQISKQKIIRTRP